MNAGAPSLPERHNATILYQNFWKYLFLGEQISYDYKDSARNEGGLLASLSGKDHEQFLTALQGAMDS